MGKTSVKINQLIQALVFLTMILVAGSCGESDPLPELQVSLDTRRPVLWTVDSSFRIPSESAPGGSELVELQRNWYTVTVTLTNTGDRPIVIQGIRWVQIFQGEEGEQFEEGGITNRPGSTPTDAPVLVALDPAGSGGVTAASIRINVTGLPTEIGNQSIRGEFEILGWIGTVDVPSSPIRKTFRVTTTRS